MDDDWRNNGSMRCFSCGCTGKKGHKCHSTNASGPKDYRIGNLSLISCRGKNNTRRTYHQRNNGYNQRFFRRTSNGNSTQHENNEIGPKYRQDFHNEYFDYRFNRRSSDMTSDERFTTRRNTGRVECPNRKRKRLYSSASDHRKEKSRRVDTDIHNNDKNETESDNIPRNEQMNNRYNKGYFMKNQMNERRRRKSADKRFSRETEMTKEKAAKDSYRNGRYDLALAQYTELINFYPRNEIYYDNRSACNMMMGYFEKAIADAKKSIHINSQFIQGHYRVIKYTMITGKIDEIETYLLELEKINATDHFFVSTRKTLGNLKEYLKLEKEARDENDNTTALHYINKCIEICPFSVAYKLRKARYLAYGERYDEADEIAHDILDNDRRNPWAKYILGIHMYHTNLEEAIPYLENIIRHAPKLLQPQTLYQKAKQLNEIKAKGNEAFRAGEFCKAHGFYMRAMKIDRTNKKLKMQLYNNMAQASYKLGMRVKSIRECTRALEIDEKYLKPLRRRGCCHIELGDYLAAMKDFQRCFEIDQGVEYRNLLNEAKMKQEEKEREERERQQREEEERRKKEEEERRGREEAERRKKEEEERRRREEEQQKQEEKDRGKSGCQQSNSNDFYDILGVSRCISLEAIKTAYRKLAKIHHPDRHSNASDEVRKENEEKMKLITQAYRKLTNA